MYRILILCAILYSQTTYAQEDQAECNCERSLDRPDLVPLPHIREADVMWSTAIWRDIDMRQKINQPMYFPLEPSNGYTSLFDLMTTEISKGCMIAYAPSFMTSGGEFSSVMSCSQLDEIITTRDTIYTDDLDGGDPIPVPVEETIKSYQITRYRVKEQWVFDKQRSRMFAHTIGIAPMVEVWGEDGEFRGYRVLFWIHYPESRHILADYPVFVRRNDNKSLSFDDLFSKRYYDGFVVKESNVFDRGIWEYSTGVDALLKGEKIEEQIHNMESDFWAY